MRNYRSYLPFALGMLLFLQIRPAQAATIFFDDLNDGDSVTNQYAGLTFTNATVLTAGISLNEFEFPPVSGSNVVFDDGGPITIVFASPVSIFSGRFTYSVPLTVTAFNAGNAQVAEAVSAFASNLGLSGDVGSSPNELLQVNFAGGIKSVTIGADSLGTSFALDDVSFTPADSSGVPEPQSAVLFLIGLAGMRLVRRNTNV